MLMDALKERARRISEKALKAPETDDELYEWIRDVLGYKIARTTTDPEHQAPFQFIADAYFERYPTMLAQGPRGGGKTLGFAILEYALMVFKPNIYIVAVAGSQEQAISGYAYLSGNSAVDGVTGLVYNKHLTHLLDREPRVTKTVLSNGSRIEIRTGGSEKAVSGPHPQVLIVDELDHIDPGPLNTALQMPQSNKQYKSVALLASSQYHTTGTLQDMLDSSEDRGIKTYRYDLFDVMESCGKQYPDQCEDCPFYMWKNPYTGAEEELCNGRIAQSDGHYTFRDAVSKFANINAESFALQSLLMTGASQGLVYSQYSKRNKKAFKDTEHDISTWRAFAGIDMRGRGRIVVILESPQTLPNGKHKRWVVREWADESNTPSKLIYACARIKSEILDEYGLVISTFWAERPDGDLIRGFPKSLSAQTVPKEVGGVIYGVAIVRDYLLDNSGEISLLIDTDRCPQLDDAMQNYKHKSLRNGGFDRNAFETSNSDFCDALRYAIVGGVKAVTHLPEQEVMRTEERMESMSRSIANMPREISGGRWSPY